MKKILTLRIPIELYTSIKTEAEKKGIPIHSLIITALWEHLESNKSTLGGVIRGND